MFILAGGKGTRFFPFTSIIPKCLIPIASKPCVSWIVEDAIEQGYDDIVLCINKKDQLNFRHEFRDLKIKYSVTDEPLGTCAEIINAKRQGLIKDTFIIRYGDDLTEVVYADLVEYHQKMGAIATFAVTSEYELPIGVFQVIVPVGTYEAVGFEEKPKLGQLIWTGCGVLEPEVLQYFHINLDIAKYVIPRLIEDRRWKVYTYNTKSHWYDVGNLENYTKADEYFRRNKL